MRDSYDQTEQGFAEWKAAGDTGAYDWGGHLDVIRAAAAPGVTIRRVRVVSEPLSDYLRREHACTTASIEAGRAGEFNSPAYLRILRTNRTRSWTSRWP
jgi:hypothetical protein